MPKKALKWEQGFLIRSSMPSINEIKAALQALPRGQLTAISRETGIDQGTLSKYRHHDRTFNYDTGCRIVEALRERGFLE